MNSRVIAAMLMGLLVASATPAMAQDQGSGWYASVGAGRLNTDFRPYYTYFAGGTPDQFENEANGLQVEVTAGRRRQLTKRFALSVQGSAAYNSFSWSLTIPSEPSALEYSLPYQFAASLVPELQLGRVSLYADIGGGLGRARQMKTSTASNISAYDYDKMRPTLNVGGGIRLKATEGIQLFAHVGHVRYSGYEFDTRNAAGTRIEHFTDSPRATGFTAGIIKRF